MEIITKCMVELNEKELEILEQAVDIVSKITDHEGIIEGGEKYTMTYITLKMLIGHCEDLKKKLVK